MNDDLRRTIGAILVIVGIGVVGILVFQFLFWISYIVGWIGVGFLAIVTGSALLDN